MNKVKKIVLLLQMIVISIILVPYVVYAGAGDFQGGASNPNSSGELEDSSWTGIYGQRIAGVRVTIVDGNGNMVSQRSKDYLSKNTNTKDLTYINSGKNYYRCLNNVKHKLAYIKGDATCQWGYHDATEIAEILNWLPYIYSVDDASQIIKDTILNMTEDELKNTFFDDIGYTIPNSIEERNNHYLIFEPLTLVKLGTPGVKNGKYDFIYYGTYHELAPKVKDYDFVGSLSYHYLPYSLYSIGTTEIGGSGGYKNNSYFNGLLKVVKNEYWCINTKKNNRKEICKNYRFEKGSSFAFGIGIYWLPQFTNIPTIMTCDYNNSSHFTNGTSGPNNEDCCSYVINNLSEYGITKEELYQKYPRCRSYLLDSCNFKPSITSPICGTNSYGNIKFDISWDCIYASAYSNDETIKNYFLKYQAPNNSCSVFCLDEVSTYYPNDSMTALAGNYFTIGGALKDYGTYTDSNNQSKISNADLGNVQVKVKRECRILGTATQECKNQAQAQLNNVNKNNAPQIEFAYESDYYNNPSLTLASEFKIDSSSITDKIYKQTSIYDYSLPNSSQSYNYVSKSAGISYKLASLAGVYPVINIGPHLPIHFSEKNGKTFDYQFTIKKFNIDIFDNLILKGQSVSTKFTNNIETYIKYLITSDRAKPQYINGIYYLDTTFINLLQINGYNADSFINMSCANTNDYACTYNANGIYCYDKNTGTNTEDTYILFNACINNVVNQIEYQKVNYQNDMLYECYFTVHNDDFSKNKGIIFRPISLNNPFPSIDGDGRQTGGNWCYDDNCCYGDNCPNKNIIVDSIITNNRGVETEDIYKEREPLYKIILDPALIKKIRQYNDTTTYDDFNLECDSNGNTCKSKFIRESINAGKYDFSTEFDGCGIKNSNIDKNANNRCIINEAW